MTKVSLKDKAELIGIAAIVASLVFVGLELRLSRQAAVADIYQQRAALLIDVQEDIVDPVLTHELRGKLMRGEELAGNEIAYLNHRYNQYLAYYENNHFQHQLGLLSEEQWVASKNAMRSFFGRPSFPEWWRDNRSGWRESFALEIDEIVDDLPNNDFQ